MAAEVETLAAEAEVTMADTVGAAEVVAPCAVETMATEVPVLTAVGIFININSNNQTWILNPRAATNNRVATAQGKQGKQGIWFLLFPDRENTGNFAVTQRKNFRHRENIFL